jgi:glutaredoxin
VQSSLAVFQAEWCPYSRKVRQKLTELGVSFVAMPVPVEPADREEMRRKVGTDQIPAVLFDDGSVLKGDADAIVSELGAMFNERSDAAEHRRLAQLHPSEGVDG